jgi:hypothetical protein
MPAWVSRWRWRWPLGGAALVVVAGVVAALVWSSGASSPGPYRPASRTRSYNAFTFCLLTGPEGVVGLSAAPVWAGVEAASNATSDRAQYLAATGSVETVGSVTPYANTLVQRQCGLVLAVGSVEVAVAQSVAAENKGTEFILCGGGVARANVRVVADVSSASVENAIEAYVSSR